MNRKQAKERLKWLNYGQAQAYEKRRTEVAQTGDAAHQRAKDH